MGRCCSRSRALEAAFDVGTAVMSVTDIVADIAVAIEFWRTGQLPFFYISLGIFGIAQACYAFLFAATYGAHLSNPKKLLVFTLALPFSQLVPVFTLVESLHLDCLSSVLRSVGLRPTSHMAEGGEMDSLWVFLQRKYHAHAGFLVEALVEALPQCALQVAAVVLHRHASPLNLFSILLSLTVIASKGWLASYSLHRPTFVFNSVAIAADVAGLFASASWVALWCLKPPGGGVEAGESPWATQAAADLTDWFVWLTAAGIAGSVIAGGGTILFSMVDDHLKARDVGHYGIGVDSVFFEIYAMRGLAWLLSLLPSATLFVLCRLSLLPLIVFRSLSSEHATHHSFFSALFSWLRDGGRGRSEETAPPAAAAAPPAATAAPPAATPQGGPPRPVAAEQRLRVANALLSHALADASTLRGSLAGSAGKSVLNAREQSVLRAWVMGLGRPQHEPAGVGQELEAILPTQLDGSGEPADPIAPAAMVSTWAPRAPSVASMGKWRRRYALARHALRCRIASVKAELALRSEVFRLLMKPPRTTMTGGRPSAVRKPSGCVDHGLLLLAFVGLLLVLAAALPTLPIALILLPMGAAFPSVQAILALSAPLSEPSALMLPLILSCVHACLVAALCVLLPVVRSFQQMRIELLSTAGLPPAFFSQIVVDEIKRRWELAYDLSTSVAERDCSVCLGPCRPDEEVSILHHCSHTFHRECIGMWLASHRSCPNCRAPATLATLTSIRVAGGGGGGE